MSKRDIIVVQRDKTFFPSAYCECGYAFYLGRDNHIHYRVIKPATVSNHELALNRREIIDIVRIVAETRASLGQM